MESDDFLESNIRALTKRHPEYVGMLSSLACASRYVFEQVGSSVTCRDADGTWLHGPEDPWTAAREEAARLVDDGSALYVVVRPGIGYVGFSILEEVQKRAPGSFVLLVEDRLDFFSATLSITDWTGILESDSAEILLGRIDLVTEDFLARHPGVAGLPLTLVTTPTVAAELDAIRLAERLEELGTKLRACLEGELATADDSLRSRRGRREPLRVLLAGAEFGYLAAPIAEGFRACDVDAEIRPGDTRTPRVLRASDWISEIAALAPDIVLWVNRPELSDLGTTAFRALEVVNVLWSLDSPRRMKVTPPDLSAMDVFLCFDPRHLSAFAGCGARRSAQLSLAAGVRPLPDASPGAACWPARLGPDISFVGSLGESRIGEFRELLRRRNPERLAFLARLASETADPASEYERLTGERFEGAPCVYVEETRSQRRRLEVLSALPASSLKIFGGFDWARAATPLAACHAGRAPRYGFELAAVYYHSRVNVNIFHEQCLDSTNSRVYDVLAAGGFLLTEHRPCLEREFQIGRHLVSFSTPDEAREKAEYYLARPQEREEIAREGQKHVLANHTFSDRCSRLLDLAVQRE